jgi:hypothetical protein
MLGHQARGHALQVAAHGNGIGHFARGELAHQVFAGVAGLDQALLLQRDERAARSRSCIKTVSCRFMAAVTELGSPASAPGTEPAPGPGHAAAMMRRYWQPVALVDEFNPALDPRMACAR